MTILTSNDIGRRMNLSLYNNSILQNTYQNVKLVDVLSFRTASKEADVTSLHLALYPSLPTGVPRDPVSLKYLSFETPSGGIVVLAADWINPESIQLLEGSKATITLNSITPEQLQIIRNFLLAQNIGEFFITPFITPE